MKTFTIALATVLLATPLFGQEKTAKGAPKDLKDRFSYSIGVQIGMNFQKQHAEVTPDMVAAGIRDALAGQPQMTPDQIRDTLMEVEKDMGEKAKVVGEKNKADGEKFLADNKSKSGVKTTASGLQYIAEKEGSGTPPLPADTVTVNYRGTLIDGTEFDSSYKRGEPATFPVSGVIKGWTEALQLMKKGAKYKLFIPSGLAYGDRGAPPDIAPNSTLIFEVELLDIKTAGPNSATPPLPSPEKK